MMCRQNFGRFTMIGLTVPEAPFTDNHLPTGHTQPHH
jgi:hypothetical protein